MRRLEQHQKVLGIGLSKTGTTSLTRALNLLGINTVHNPHDGSIHRELSSGDFRLSILEKYQAITDIPIAPYYAQLDQIYPDSKFILTTRNVDSWIQSTQNHWRLMPSWEADEFYKFLHAAVYGCLKYDEARFRFVYETHCRNVVDYFSGRPEDLLVMNIIDGDGWEVLCPFLGLAVPDIPFPHQNTAGETAEWASRLDRTVAEIETTIPENNPFILVDEQEFGRILIGGHRPIPFLERNGEWWGRPEDSKIAIQELERLRDEGAVYIVFAWPAFWWLEHYSEFVQYLRSKYKCMKSNDRLTIFSLKRKG